MLVKKTTDLSKEAIFRTIMTSLKRDYEQATGQSLKSEDISSGLNYIKRFGQSERNSIKITIQTIEEPTCYAVLYSSNRGKQLLTYQLTSVLDGKTEISCQQSVFTESVLQKANHYVSQVLFKKSLEKRLKAQLQGLIVATLQSEKECVQ